MSDLLFLLSAAHRYPHSFPTRRSSDLFAKMFIIATVLGILLLEGGTILINGFQAQDVAEGTATEAGITYAAAGGNIERAEEDRKSTRLNSSHHVISYDGVCLKKKRTRQ